MLKKTWYHSSTSQKDSSYAIIARLRLRPSLLSNVKMRWCVNKMDSVEIKSTHLGENAKHFTGAKAQPLIPVSPNDTM